ncbi:MAG: sigma 54-interacting transcriptional regulator, partial [Candidatus Poribacteria bacterium]
ITGETGTGKELVARTIHYNSLRKDKRLFVINCSAIPKEVLPSELFGHRKGAFNEAIEHKIGLFEAAEGSTLILDEIDKLPIDVQPSLLCVLNERKVQRFGETISRDVDVRAIAITDHNLTKLVEMGRFREDLYSQLKAFEIYLPPLRKRSEDIPLLIEHFYQEACRQLSRALAGFAPDALEMLLSYHWPGNVRELRSAIRRAYALAEEGERIQIHHFPSQMLMSARNE